MTMCGINDNNIDTGGNQSVFDGGTAVTVSAWVKAAPSNGVFAAKSGVGFGWQVGFNGSNSTPLWTTRGLGNEDLSGNRYMANGWHMVTVTYDGADRCGKLSRWQGPDFPQAGHGFAPGDIKI